jgi:hypothetical protein
MISFNRVAKFDDGRLMYRNIITNDYTRLSFVYRDDIKYKPYPTMQITCTGWSFSWWRFWVWHEKKQIRLKR